MPTPKAEAPVTAPEVEDKGTPAAEVALPPAGPFSIPVTRNQPPTEAQHTWLRNHPDWSRVSHARLGFAQERGTLHADGSFIPESQMPLLDGGGSFSVGKVVARRR